MSHSSSLDTSYRIPVKLVLPQEDTCCHQSWKLITVVALVALAALAVGVLTLLSSHYPALSDLKVLGVAGGAAFIGVGGFLFVVTLFGIVIKCKEEPLKVPLQPPENDVSQGSVVRQIPPPQPDETSLVIPPPPLEPAAPQLSKPEAGVSEKALRALKHIYHDGFYSAIVRAIDQKTHSEYPVYLSKGWLPQEVFLGKYWYASPLDPGVPKPDFDKLARLFVMGDKELLNLPCREILTYDPYELTLIHCRLLIMENVDKSAPKESDEQEYDPKSSLGHLRSLSGYFLSSKNLDQIPPQLLSLLHPQQIDAILLTRGFEKAFMHLLIPPDDQMFSIQTSIRRRRDHILNELSMQAIERQLTLLLPYLRNLDNLKLKSSAFPWAQLIMIPNATQQAFGLGEKEIARTREMLQNLEWAAINSLLPILSGKHLRLLSDTQLGSKNFPVAELVTRRAKAAEFLDVSTPDKECETARIQLAMDPQVVQQLNKEKKS